MSNENVKNKELSIQQKYNEIVTEDKTDIGWNQIKTLIMMEDNVIELHGFLADR